MSDILKKLFASSVLLLLVWGWAQDSEAETQVMNGVDDGTVHIPLGHSFPYYGGVFTDAWMSSNGFIILYDPTSGYGNSKTWNNGCCNGFFPGGMDSPFSYMIAPFWTDLRHITSIADSGYFYETGEGGTWFEWRNLVEYGTSDNLNTFGLQLWPDGSFDFQYAKLDIDRHNVWIGFTGDATSQQDGVYDKINELFYGEYAFNGAENGMTTSDVTAFTVAETNYGYAWWGEDGGYSGGPDCSNPLNDPTCPGYDEAYFNQQCEQNPLYDTQCPGYAEAYYNQQCTADPLYDSGCPGYAEAYYDQQCELDPLYDSGCPGYAQAYYDQQCSLDALYDTGCPGYAEAYYNQQCELDPLYDTGCIGYDDAYFDYQCTLNPQYDKMCPGWVDPDLFKDPVDDFSNQSMGIDDGSDDGSNVDVFGNQKEEEKFFADDPIEDLVEESYKEEFFVEEKYDTNVQETFMDKDEKMFTEELVASDGNVDEMRILEESVFFEEPEPIEEEIEILEKEEIIEVEEELVLEEEVELDTVELVTVTEKVTTTPKVDAVSLVLQQTAALVSELRSESEQSGTQSASNSVNSTQITENSTENDQKTQQSRSQIVQNVQNVENLSVDGSEMSSSDGFYGTDLSNFVSMTQNATSEAENVTENEQNTTDTENVEQNLALGDSAPIGFAIVPVQGVSGVEMVMVPVEEQSLAERLAERVRQRNLENSNAAAVGQTAVLQNIASATDMSVYYDTTTTYTQDIYSQEQVYSNAEMSDNAKSHYKMFSENHGTMQELIRSQY